MLSRSSSNCNEYGRQVSSCGRFDSQRSELLQVPPSLSSVLPAACTRHIAREPMHAMLNQYRHLRESSCFWGDILIDKPIRRWSDMDIHEGRKVNLFCIVCHFTHWIYHTTCNERLLLNCNAGASSRKRSTKLEGLRDEVLPPLVTRCIANNSMESLWGSKLMWNRSLTHQIYNSWSYIAISLHIKGEMFRLQRARVYTTCRAWKATRALWGH